MTPKRVFLALLALVLLVLGWGIMRQSMSTFGLGSELLSGPQMMSPMMNDASYTVSGSRGTAMMKGGYAMEDGYNSIEVTSAVAYQERYPIPSPSVPQGDAKIIRSGDMTLLVERVDVAAEKITAIRKQYKGEAGDATFSEYRSGVRSGDITIWVPAERFDEAVAEIKKLALRVEHEYVRVSDVSTEYVDLEARLKNLRAAETQYTAILTRAGKISEVLDVTRELNNTRGEIERTQAQLNLLAQRVALSSIHISLTEEDVPSSATNEWRPISVLKTALKGLLNDLISIANMLIVFVVRLPILILTIGFWVLIIWALYKSGRFLYRKVSATNIPPVK